MVKSTYTKAFEEGLAKLNDRQQQAVQAIDGPVMVVAGPGTGKTQILALRIGNILTQTDTRPANILCLTFTDAGQIQMRKRLLSFIGPTAYQVQIHTYHSFCNQVIQENQTHFSDVRQLHPASPLEEIELLHQLIDQLPVDHPFKKYRGQPYFEASRLKRFFSLMKTEDWSVEFVLSHIAESRQQIEQKRASSTKRKQLRNLEILEAAVNCFEDFQNMMREAGRYNFDDMISWVLAAFRKDDDLLAYYQEQYQYFLVDEYQDTNGAQNEILELLADFWEKPNLFAVGDDDQAIFRFQGANMQNLIDLYEKYHPQVIVLNKNYRSSQLILSASTSLVGHNLNRLVNQIPGIEKSIEAAGPFAKHKQKPKIVSYLNRGEEEASIVEQIKSLKEKGIPLSSVAVIYKRHSQAKEIIEALEKQGVAVEAKQKVNILQEPIIRCIRNILGFIHAETSQPDTSDSILFEIMHYRFFGLPNKETATIAMHCWQQKPQIPIRDVLSDEELLNSLDISNPVKFLAFEKLIGRWIEAYPQQTLLRFLEMIWQEGQILKEIFASDQPQYLLQTLVTFFRFVQQESAKNPDIRLSALLDYLKRMDDNSLPLEMFNIIRQQEAVQFLSAHGSKGLEFDYVFVIGLIDFVWKSQSSNWGEYSLPQTLSAASKATDLEDERRLLYVATTRARKYLQLSFHEQNHHGRDQQMSGFVEEFRIQDDLPISKGSATEHQLTDFFHTILTPTKKQVALIDPSRIDKYMERFSMTPTKLNAYLRCPRSFYFDYILRVPKAPSPFLGFGSAVHAALERAVKHIDSKNEMIATALDAFGHSMVEHQIHFTSAEFENYAAYGGRVISQYCSERYSMWKGAESLTAEYYIPTVIYRNVPISGKIDLIESYTNHQHYVLDYKTGNPDNNRQKVRPPDNKNPNGGDHWRQMVMYQILLQKDPQHAYQMDKGQIVFIQPQKDDTRLVKDVHVSENHVEMVSQQIVESYRRMRNYEFDRACEDPKCYWCQFVKNDFVFTEDLKRNDTDEKMEAVDFEAGQLAFNF